MPTFLESVIGGCVILYKKFGFIEDELTMDFDYPHQKRQRMHLPIFLNLGLTIATQALWKTIRVNNG